MKLSDIKVGDVITEDAGTTTMTEEMKVESGEEILNMYYDDDEISVNHFWRLFAHDSAFSDTNGKESNITKIERNSKVIFERE